jgi:hypothetical protein
MECVVIIDGKKKLMQTFISKNKYFIRFFSQRKKDVQYNVLIKKGFVTNLAKQNTKNQVLYQMQLSKKTKQKKIN